MSDIQIAKQKLEQAQRDYENAIAGEKQALLKQRAEIDKKLAAFGVDEPASAGKRRTGVKDSVLGALKSGPKNKSQILTALGAKGDKSFEGSISNALASMKKAGTVKQDSNSNYSVA